MAVTKTLRKRPRRGSALAQCVGAQQVLTRVGASARARTLAAWVVAIAACVFFLLYGTLDDFATVFPLRLQRLIALIVVASSLSAATVVFQAVTRNRILSPGVMGFDEMFRLVVTAFVFFLGANVVNHFPAAGLFLITATVMTAIAVTLFLTLLRRGKQSVHLLVLIGIVLGILMRSLTTLMSLILDPGEFFSVQNRTVTSFAATDKASLWVTGIAMVLCVGFVILRRHSWDILYLGEEVATTLGLNYRREIKTALSVSAFLVACSTALVGPFMFFGLIVVNIAVFYVGSSRITHLLPTAVAVGTIVLVGGQAILENVFHRAVVLPVVIELVGGVLLLIMIVRGTHRR